MEDYGIEIGTANYSGSRKRSFKLEKQKANEYRPLPPLGEAAKRGLWMVPYAVHWGDKGSDGKMKPYQCIQKMEKLADGSKRVIKRCPRCEKNFKVKEKRDARAAQLKAGGMNDAQIAEKLMQVDKYLRDFNRGFRFYMNALNKNMEIGRLDISATHADQLREQISNLLKNGVDVTAPNQGAFMNFFYEGLKGHTVTPVMVAGSTPGSMQLQLAPLTPNIMRSLKAESWDLLSLYPSLTESEIQRLVDNEGNPEVVDNVFASGKTEDRPAATAPAQQGPKIVEQKFDDGLDAMIGSGGAVSGTGSNQQSFVAEFRPTSAVVAQAAPVPPPAQNIAEMSTDDFLSEFGV